MHHADCIRFVSVARPLPWFCQYYEEQQAEAGSGDDGETFSEGVERNDDGETDPAVDDNSFVLKFVSVRGGVLFVVVR